MTGSQHLVQILQVATSAHAGNASATGTAYNPTAVSDSIPAFAETTTGTGVAYNAAPTGTSNAAPGVASSTGTASDAHIDIDLAEADGAAGHEAELVQVLISDSEAGTGADNQTAPAEPTTGAETGTGSETESVFISIPAPGDPGGAITPRWIFLDGTEELPFEINPSDTNEIQRNKTLKYANTLGPSNASVIFEEQGDQLYLGWSGTTLTQGQYENFIDWFDRPRSIQLLDDLGRLYTIYISEFTPKRVRNAQYPWLHTYDMKALVLSEG